MINVVLLQTQTLGREAVMDEAVTAGEDKFFKRNDGDRAYHGQVHLQAEEQHQVQSQSDHYQIIHLCDVGLDLFCGLCVND